MKVFKIPEEEWSSGLGSRQTVGPFLVHFIRQKPKTTIYLAIFPTLTLMGCTTICKKWSRKFSPKIGEIIDGGRCK